MIEGITILNQSQADSSDGLLFGFGILFLIVGIIVLLVSCCDISITGCICGISFSVFGLLLLFCSETEDPNRFRYECIIDSSVSFENIYENYEVIKQRGEIWVLEDKEKED